MTKFESLDPPSPISSSLYSEVTTWRSAIDTVHADRTLTPAIEPHANLNIFDDAESSIDGSATDEFLRGPQSVHTVATFACTDTVSITPIASYGFIGSPRRIEPVSETMDESVPVDHQATHKTREALPYGSLTEEQWQLFASVLKDVPIIARKFKSYRLEQSDLVQEGGIGLFFAAKRFDKTMGNSFKVFAESYIVGHIKHALRDKEFLVRVPRSEYEQYSHFRLAEEELSNLFRRPPTPIELSEYMNVPLQAVRDNILARNASFVTSTEDKSNVAQVEKMQAGGDMTFGQFENSHVLAELIAKLDPRSQRILKLRYWEDMKQADIAREIGMSQMQVSRLLKSAREKLQCLMDPQDWTVD